jgi:hypothetical protein
MRNLILTALLLVPALLINAQSSPVFTRYKISETGCSAYFPSDPGQITVEQSPDSLSVYTGEATWGSANYALILVDLEDHMADLSIEELEDLMTAYMDYLQGEFDLTESTGYGKGHTLDSNPDATGIIDYWEDDDGTKYDVKSWADNHFLSVLIVYSTEDVDENYKSMFLDGFRFPSATY